MPALRCRAAAPQPRVAAALRHVALTAGARNSMDEPCRHHRVDERSFFGSARELVPKHAWLLVGGTVPALMPELALTLGHREARSVLDAGQQEGPPSAQHALPGAQRQVGTAQLLCRSWRGHTEPPSVFARPSDMCAGFNRGFRRC